MCARQSNFLQHDLYMHVFLRTTLTKKKKTSNPAERVENDKWRPSDSNFFFGRVECNHCLGAFCVLLNLLSNRQVRNQIWILQIVALA